MCSNSPLYSLSLNVRSVCTTCPFLSSRVLSSHRPHLLFPKRAYENRAHKILNHHIFGCLNVDFSLENVRYAFSNLRNTLSQLKKVTNHKTSTSIFLRSYSQMPLLSLEASPSSWWTSWGIVGHHSLMAKTMSYINT